MKKLRFVFTFTVLLTLLLSSAAFAQSPGGDPAGVNTFNVSPDPAYQGDTVTLTINFNATAGADGQTRFCLYAPATAVGTFPSSITLSYFSGFSSTPVTFNTSAATCPGRTGQTGQMYDSGAAGLPTGDTTYDGSATFTISGSATPGLYDWTLLLEEPGSGVNPLSYVNHEIKATPPPADTGLSGRLIDSKTLQPWKYGAEIKVIQTSGTNVGLKGSTFVSLADGTWSITFGTTDDLSICGGSCTAGEPYATYQVVVNFTCDLATANGTRPNYATTSDANCPITASGTPLTGLPTNFEVTVTDGASGAIHNMGDIETQRGPTAIRLENFSAQSASQWTLVLAGAGLLALVAAGFVVTRRKRAL